MFLDAWPAGKAGMGCGAFPEGLLMKTIFFFLIPARNQILNIVVENPNGLGCSNKTSWCLVLAVLFDPSLVPVPGSGVMQWSFTWKCAQDVFQEENHCQSK